MVIVQGDVFWIELMEPIGSSPGYRHPHVVIQNDVYNQSRIRTVVVCALTSNVMRASVPGNVLLEADEAGLARPSVAVVSQLVTVDKSQLVEYIGTLSPRRVRQILHGVQLLLEPSATE